MTRLRKRLLVSGAALSVVGALVSPHLLRWYIQDHYDIKVGSLGLGWFQVTLHDVQVYRPNLEAQLPEVRVNTHRQIRVLGGRVSLDLDQGAKNKESEKRDIEASNLTVSVRKDSWKADLFGVNLTPQRVSFQVAHVEFSGRKLEAQNGTVARDKSLATAKRVKADVRLPFKIPRLEDEYPAELVDIKVYPGTKLAEARSATFGPFTVEGPATARLEEGQVVLEVPKLGVNHPWVSPKPVIFEKVRLSAPTTLLESGEGVIQASIGKANIRIHPKSYWVEGDENCADWTDILPRPLPQALQEASQHLKGDLSFRILLKPKPKIGLRNRCGYDCSDDLVKRLRSRFTYTAYDSKNQLFERTAGRSTAEWVPLESLPLHVPKAFTTLEDPGFLGHRGVIPQALENSLRDNLKLGRFFRGGSTITMQLARNLWLRRHKTFERKAEEVLLSFVLESCFSKGEILELYLNVVEFGPDLYGIGPAAQHYFHKAASELEVEEAFYLASILPNPKKAIPPDSGGLQRTRGLMRALAKSGFISEELIDSAVDSQGWITAE